MKGDYDSIEVPSERTLPMTRGSPQVEEIADDQRQLLAGVLAKDRKATAEFVSQCADYAYPFVCRRLMPRKEAVEDLMQEILLAAWQNLPNFRGDSSLRSWILGIARHKVEDYYRKRFREPDVDESDDSEDEALDMNAAIIPKLEERLDRATRWKKVQKILVRLPETYGLALLWRYRDEMSLSEMAELTGKTEKAMERLLARARESFKRTWNDE
jgi:RNA polymerase sigma-70 factor (ECF subfamily)